MIVDSCLFCFGFCFVLFGGPPLVGARGYSLLVSVPVPGMKLRFFPLANLMLQPSRYLPGPVDHSRREIMFLEVIRISTWLKLSDMLSAFDKKLKWPPKTHE